MQTKLDATYLHGFKRLVINALHNMPHNRITCVFSEI